MRWRWIILIVIVLAIAGCGKKSKDIFYPPPFALTVDTLTVDGTVTDNLDSDPTLTVNGSGATVTAGAFSEVLDATSDTVFVFEATDHAGNTTQTTIRVQ